MWYGGCILVRFDSYKEIDIRPNPTDGVLKICINNLEASDEAVFMIFNLAGVLVLDRRAETTETVLDITFCPPAIYLLIISINGEKTSWRMIKK